MTTRATIETMAEWLSARDDILLLGHVNPDGDAAGSCLGLCHALAAMGKRAAVFLPGGVPKLYADLPGAESVLHEGDALPFAPMTALSVDASEPARLGEEGLGLFEGCQYRGVVDHHATNPGFGQIMLLDENASAAGELAVALIEAMGERIDRDAAECLFVAISTDSGHFSYASTRPETFRAAQHCAAAGIAINKIAARLYRTRTYARTKLLGLALARFEISDDGRMAWTYVTKEMFDAAGATAEDTEGIVNYLQEISGVKFALLAEERGEATKLSMRSRGELDVAASVAVPLGGGGHARAAGATVALPMEAACERARALAGAALDRL